MTRAIAGKDYVGVGVGAIVVDDDGKVFLARRGAAARNERGAWEFPGGRVEFGDALQATLKREFLEEYGMTIEIGELLSVDDHILPDEGQHWVSATYIAGSIGAAGGPVSGAAAGSAQARGFPAPGVESGFHH